MGNGHLEEVVVGSLVNGPFAPLLLFLSLHWHFCVYFDTSSLLLCFFCPSLFSINYNYLHFHILLLKLILVMFVAFLIWHQFFVLLHVFSAHFSLWCIFQRFSHFPVDNCDWICEKGSYMHNYKYLEIPF